VDQRAHRALSGSPTAGTQACHIRLETATILWYERPHFPMDG
jgi:hypothetical protein